MNPTSNASSDILITERIIKTTEKIVTFPDDLFDWAQAKYEELRYDIPWLFLPNKENCKVKIDFESTALVDYAPHMRCDEMLIRLKKNQKVYKLRNFGAPEEVVLKGLKRFKEEVVKAMEAERNPAVTPNGDETVIQRI